MRVVFSNQNPDRIPLTPVIRAINPLHDRTLLSLVYSCLSCLDSVLRSNPLTPVTGAIIPLPVLTPTTGAIIPYKHSNQSYGRHVTSSVQSGSDQYRYRKPEEIDMIMKMICCKAFEMMYKLTLSIFCSELTKFKIILSQLNKPIKLGQQ